MRKLILTAALAALIAACSPPAPQSNTDGEAPPPVLAACNTVSPDSDRQVRVEEELAVASAAADLRGGAIAPGVYDLVRAVRIESARGWSDTRAVALQVTESETGGVTFDWAALAPGGEIDRWTADFTETPRPRLAYSCGRIGEVDAEFTAGAEELQLRLPDGANGRLWLTFRRRA